MYYKLSRQTYQRKGSDDGNAFLYGKIREKVYVIADPEFGELEARTEIDC
jgi:hypothetical protein